MKTTLFLFIMLLLSCTKEELQKPYENNTYASQDSLYIDVVSTIPNLKIVIAKTEDQTYTMKDDHDCIRIIHTSGYKKQITLIRNYDPEFVRIEVNGITFEVMKL